MVYSNRGLNGMSQAFHSLYRARLARGYWRDRPRPILINNWEATYFDFNEEKILEIVRTAKQLGIELGEERDYGVGMFFFPQDELKRNRAKKMFEVIVAKEGMEFLGWRKVPVCPEVLGQKALSKMPNIQQAS